MEMMFADNDCRAEDKSVRYVAEENIERCTINLARA